MASVTLPAGGSSVTLDAGTVDNSLFVTNTGSEKCAIHPQRILLWPGQSLTVTVNPGVPVTATSINGTTLSYTAGAEVQPGTGSFEPKGLSSATNTQLSATFVPSGGSYVAYMPAPSGDTTGATDTANFKAALASLPTVTIYPTPSTKAGTSATFHVGTVYLKSAFANVFQDQIGANITGTGTPYYFGTSGVSTGDVGNIGPFVSIIGPGHNTCVIRYIGSGDCLRMYNTVFPSSDTFDTLAAFAGKIDGFTIDGTLASAGAVGLHYGDTEGGNLGADLWIANFTGGVVGTPSGASKGIFFDNAVSWTENVYAHVNLYNNTIGVYYAKTTGDLSFMYSDVYFKIYAWPNQYGVMFDGGANFDQGSFVLRANMLDGVGSNTGALIAFGTSTGPNNRIADSHLDIQAEVNGGLPGGAVNPRTIYVASAFYQILNTQGIISFGNSWTASNFSTSYPLVHDGPITGDSVLAGIQTLPGSKVTTNAQTASYTLTLPDAGRVVEVNSASGTTVTVPPDSTAAFAVGALIEVSQIGAGQVTIAAGAGVTLRSAGAKTAIASQYTTVGLRKRAANDWILVGNLA